MRTRKRRPAPSRSVARSGSIPPFRLASARFRLSLPGFLRSHPALTIDLGLNDRQVDLIEEGWDLAVRIGDMADSSLIARRLAPCHTAVCAAPRYLSEKGTPRTVSDLTGHNCLGYTLSRALGTSSWQFGSDRKTNAPVSGSLKANNGDALVAAAVAGEGIVYQPTFLVAREIAAGLLVPIELDLPPISVDGIFAIYPANRRPPAKVRAFIDFLAKSFGPVPEWDRICEPRTSPVRPAASSNPHASPRAPPRRPSASRRRRGTSPEFP